MPGPARAEAWGIPQAVVSSRCKVVAGLVLLAPALLFGIVGYGFWGFPGLVPAAIALALAALIVRTASSGLLSTLEPSEAKDPRLLNLVAGLSSDLGVETPPVFVVRAEGANAIVFDRGGRPAVGITEGALRQMTRIELEAMVAHCLVRTDPASGGLDRSDLRLGGVFRSCGGRVTELEDARTVAVTRYPPALASAIAKATPASGRFSYLWFVAEDPSHSPRAERLEALATL
jgi:hypothetical protein